MFQAKPGSANSLHLSSNYIGILAILFLFASSRAFLFAQGVRPDPEILAGFMQYLDIYLLENDLFTSVFYMHSQPPAWNLLMGGILKLSRGNLADFSILYLLGSYILSLSTAILIFLSQRILKVPLVIAFSSSCFYIFFSSAYFWESFIYYPLFTAFLVVLSFWSVACSATTNSQKSRTIFLCIALLSLLILSLTWTLFHPLIMWIMGIILVFFISTADLDDSARVPFRLFNGKRQIRSALICFFFTIACSVVPCKNLLLFGTFNNGSWGGMGLAQNSPVKIEECTFYSKPTYQELLDARGLTDFTKRNIHASHYSLEKSFKSTIQSINHNNAAYVVRSKRCSLLAMEAIANNPIGFAIERGKIFIASNLILSDHFTWKPFGLRPGDPLFRAFQVRNLIYLPLGTHSSGYKDKVKTFPLHLAPIAIPASIFMVPLVTLGWLGPAKRFAFNVKIIFLYGTAISLWLLFAGIAFNGGEQYRMRFTIEPLLLTYLPIFFYYLFSSQMQKDAPSRF